MKNYLNDTICALATGKIDGTLAIIRLSGDKAFNCINKLLKKNIHNTSERNIFYTKLYAKNKIIDEVILLTYQKTKSFTGEQLVEIICHANYFIVEDILKNLIENDARNAENGEFTKRAFINNKIDLLKAESINELILAKNKYVKDESLKNIDNFSKKNLEDIKQKLITIIGHLETNIDYSEYKDIKQITHKEILPIINTIQEILDNTLIMAKRYLKAKQGLNVIIVGQPNSGKSSLFNLLVKQNKVIVSEIPGTTRDSIEAEIIINDNMINLVDTAGIRESNNKVELLGIEKTYDWINKADLIIYLISLSKNNYDFDRKIITKIQKKAKGKIIEIFNKKDLLKTKSNQQNYISVLNNDINYLTNQINLFTKKIVFTDYISLNNQRQILIIQKIDQLLKKFKKEQNIGIPLDICNIYLYQAYEKINELLGIHSKTEIIDSIFKQFCLGK